MQLYIRVYALMYVHVTYFALINSCSCYICTYTCACVVFYCIAQCRFLLYVCTYLHTVHVGGTNYLVADWGLLWGREFSKVCLHDINLYCIAVKATPSAQGWCELDSHTVCTYVSPLCYSLTLARHSLGTRSKTYLPN